MERIERSSRGNDYFFNQESKAMMYVLGISFAKYTSGNANRNNNIWQSTSKPLLEIVKSCLDSEKKIYSRNYKNIREGGNDFTMYRLQISNFRIVRALHERGLGVPKKERTFPKDIKEQYLDHFVRGIFDAQVSCYNGIQIYGKNNEYASQFQDVTIGQFGISFLQDLCKTLVEYAQIKNRKTISKPPLLFKCQNVTRISKFLYRDWEFLKQNGLYLPSKKEKFDVHYDIKNPPIPPTNRMIETAKIQYDGFTRK